MAAFANSAGGFLIFGVTNDPRVEGVTNTELVRDFGGKLRDGLSPSAEFRFAVRPHTLENGRFVYVAHVPKSARGPYALSVNGALTFRNAPTEVSALLFCAQARRAEIVS